MTSAVAILNAKPSSVRFASQSLASNEGRICLFRRVEPDDREKGEVAAGGNTSTQITIITTGMTIATITSSHTGIRSLTANGYCIEISERENRRL